MCTSTVCSACVGVSFEVKIEADSNDVTEHPHDVKQRPNLCTVCDKWFTSKRNLSLHKQTHTTEKLSVRCVTKVSVNPAICVDINVVCTTSEDLVTVVTVGSCLKLALH